MLRTEQIGDSYVLNYRYDDNGTLLSVSSYNISSGATNILYAQTNTRGDVIALYDGNGDIRTIYTYDAWGKLVSVTDGEGNALGANKLGSLNSIRYRGYVYDSETGLYYLQSRYYDPEVGRFLNADSVDYIGYSDSVISYNIFAYCENNAVNGIDFTGYMAGTATLLGGVSVFVAAVLIAAVVIMIAQHMINADVSFGQVLSDVIDAMAEQTKMKVSTIVAFLQFLNITTTLSQTENDLNGIASKYKNLECVEAAKAMAKYLLKKKLNAKIFHIKFKEIRDSVYIYSNTKNDVISENGNHYGIYYNGKVYCNVHPYGLEKEKWINDFDCYGVPMHHEHSLNWNWVCKV